MNKLLWVVAAALSALLMTLCSLTEKTEDTTRRLQIVTSRRLQQRVWIAGNNGNGPFPLGLCQGDCDTDDDCEGDLICFQRYAGGQEVPGCTHGRFFGGRADFCTHKPGASSNNGGSSGSSSNNDGENNNNGVTIRGHEGSTSRDVFMLKLYWQRGYFWQEERVHRKWCMKCRYGCHPGMDIAIFNCNHNPTPWRFIEYNNGKEIQIKVSYRRLCMQTNTANNSILLARCDRSNPKQRFIPDKGSFHGKHFEISPKTKPGWCLTQRHHPKPYETIKLEPCKTARRTDTSYWNKF